MKYQVTATRLRPQRFEDLLGQEFVAATLQKSIEAGKIAPAYLFSGPRGCGKTSSARILAKVINCIEGPKPSPCGKCTACQEITAGSCLDVIEIDGASNTSVNDVRQIKDEILFPPNSNRYKVYIIDEVHMLSTSAFNALLKTIEEPPPYVIFIFATTEIHKVPATIKSRCQQFNFKLVSVELLKNALSKASESLNIKADDEALYWIAREATGSVRDAYTLFDQVAAFSDGHITFEKIYEKLGLTGIDSINKLVLSCVQKNPTEALNIVDEILQNGISVEQLVLDCADYFRSLLLIKHGVTKEALIGQRADRFPDKILNIWNSVQIEQALSLMLQLFKDLRFSIDPRYELELAVSRMAWLVDFVSPADLKKAFMATKKILAGQSTGSCTEQAYGSSFGQSVPQSMTSTENITNLNTGEDHSFKQAGSLTEQFKSVLKRDNKLTETNYDNKNNIDTKNYDSVQNFVNYKQDDENKQNDENQQETAQATRDNLNQNYNKNYIDDIDSFKNSIVQALSKKNALLSSAVDNSCEWNLEQSNLIIYAKSNFDISLLQKQISILQKTIVQISGEQLRVIIKEFETNNKIEDQEIKNNFPPIIESILEIFRGEVIEKSIVE